MNGIATRRGGSGGAGVGRGDGFPLPGRLSPPVGQPPLGAPTGKVLVEGYRKDLLNGFEKDRPRYNPLNADRPQSSALVDLKDPIQVHLLTETALTDSKTFEILSQEEVDDLKKQVQSLSMRIEQARANLAIQSKYRDAAISMARLYSPSKAEGKRRSLLGNRMSDSAKEAEMERLASERRCEELATELFSLEKRLMEPQRRLLQHTAGILQMTHRASSKKSGQPPVGPMLNGIPSSPESLYTYTNTRNSLEIPSEELDFDDKSLYLPLDQLDGPARQRKNTIEIPMKSPIREQNAQLRELREEVDRIKEENERILEENIRLKTLEQQLKDEMARVREDHARLKSTEEQLREENARVAEEKSRMQDETSRIMDETSRFKNADSRLKALEQQMNAETETLRTQSADQLRTISDTEARLERLNRQLRDVIVAFNPAKNGGFGSPSAAAGSGESLTSQLEYMERGLATAVEEQRAASQATEDATAIASSLNQASARVEALSREVQLILQQSNADQPPFPEGALDEQLDYLEKALANLGSELSRALDASSSASTGKRDIEQVEAVLMGLWEIIQTGEAEIEQQRAARRQKRAAMSGSSQPSTPGIPDDEDDLSSNELDGYTNEPYSLQAFSTKVQWLYAQATGLREQKYILQRQIKQQRELNNRSESEKDRELKARTDELEQAQMRLDDSERAAREAQAQLARLLGDMDTLQKTSAANESASESTAKAAQEQLRERNARVAALEAEYARVEARLAEAEARLGETAAGGEELARLRAGLAAAEEAEGKLREEVRAKEEEIDRMNVMVIELKTEVTIAKAELDGAYGSRKQRAAEAAALSKSTETEELNNQIARLKGELENTLKDLEEITRESITAEKEKLELEGRLDDVLSEKKDLEGEVRLLREKLDKEVGRLREELDKERLKVPGGAGAGGRAGANMLSEQFRATMKEERKKFQEELKEEQARRRKLEEELRALRKGQGGLSSRDALSPR
ncbi:Up-regulated during septation protein 1 domain-containing protein [Madurella fahalii]|uniref:Up-regulated during septation protein 1 domain-containing protein n=1 Tax=Madurella fahalii TaxID=1157608 RepID=A0ABQ0G766_9PEZI